MGFFNYLKIENIRMACQLVNEMSCER